LSTAPRRLGKYEFQQFLGKGNVGEVWKARDLSNRQDVALKTVYADLQRSDSHFLTRFMTDGQVLVMLRHANLVPTLEVNVTRQEQSGEIIAYLAMEYIAGQTFATYLQNTSHQSNFPALSEIINVFTSLGLALEYAYQRGIVHGNLTPANVLLNQQDTSHFPGGEPMLTDIGLVHILGSTASTSSKAPFYLSPEQAQGYPPSQRSDVYALGVILYEIYTGTVPFRGESSTAILSQHVHTLPTPPALINSIIPPALSEVILRALAKDPPARFPTVSAFAAAIADASTMQSSISFSEPLSREDSASQPLRQENSLLGVAQPPAQPGSSQFRFSGRPSLTGLTSWEATGHTPALPSTPPPAQNQQPIVTDPLSVEAINAVQSLKSELSAEQVQSPVQSLPPTPAQTTLTSYTQKPPEQSHEELPLQTSEPIEPKQMQAISPSVISQVPQTSISNTSENALQSARTQYQQPEASASVPQALQTSQLPPPVPVIPAQHKQKKTAWYIAFIALLALAIIGGTLGAMFLFNKGGANPAVAGNGNNRVFFQDGTLHNDQLRITLQNVAPPPNGQTYFAWLQDTTQHAQPLGTLSVQNGSVSFLYQGDGTHTNLISITQGILITREDIGKTPPGPSDNKVYQASFDPQFLDGLKHLLYSTPGLPSEQSIVATIQDTLHSIDDKAGSIVDTLNHDNAQAIRQATRIIEMLDNTQQAQSSGDLPSQYPSQGNVAIGLLSSPSQQGYLDILDAQLKQLEPLVANNPDAQQHLTNVKSALGDLRDWLQKMHDYDVQLLKAANLQDPGASSAALQLKQVAADSFTGRTIPPNASPQPTAGSAGAQQAYTEAQYMATLFLQSA
jgi:serine/threonine protein kinase